jgi:methylenetetrahydrofolate reductase (NADPH)
MPSKTEIGQRGIRIYFEFFPPKSEDAETQLWNTVADLAEWDADFVSVTYGAGGSTKAPTLSAVRRMIHETPFTTASHLTCVGATREDTHRVIDDLLAAGVRRFVALRGDPPGGVSAAYQPHPGGYANAAELVSALCERGNFDISVSAYPEKHPESRDTAADIDMLKRKADNGANRALTQFFFDNNAFERYHGRVRAAGVKIPIVPGIMPIQNLTQLKRFAGACGTHIPSWLDERFEGLDEDANKRAVVAADVAAEQIEDLVRRGIHEFHLYTMNRSPLVSAVLDRLSIPRKTDARAGAAA